MFNSINRIGCRNSGAGFVSPSSKDFVYTANLSIDQPAAVANLTVSTEGGATYTVIWGDGNIDSDVSSGAEASNTYGSPYEGEVLIQSESPILEIESTAGGWNFDVAELPATLTRLVMSYAAAAPYGLAGRLPVGLVHLDLSNSSANLSDEFAEGPVTLEYFDISGTNSTLIAFVSNFPDLLDYFSVAATPVVIYGDLNDAPASLTHFDASETSSFITALAQDTTMVTGVKFVDLSDTNLGSGTVDDILIALAQIASWAAPKTLDIGGNNAPRTSASDAAVATLEGLGVTVTVNETAPAAPANITITAGTPVGAVGTSIVLGKPAGVVENDVLTALIYLNEQPGAGVITPAAGSWSTAADFTGTLARDRHLYAFTLVAGASEPSTYTFNTSGPSSQIGGVILRGDGVNISNILDVAFVSGTHALDDDTEPFTAPNITTVTDNAMVILFQGISHNQCTAGGAPSGFTLVAEQVGVPDRQILVATKEQATAGSVAPGDWTSTFSANDGAASTIILALRPADGESGEPIPEPEKTTLHTDQAAGPISLAITTDDGSPFIVDWGDGTISAEIPSGAVASHSYGAAYAGDVVIHSDGNITAIESTEGGWDFALTALPATLLAFRVYGTGVTGSITGTLAQIPSGCTDFQVYNTSAAITGAFGDEPSGMVTMYFSNTNSVIGGSGANMASTMVNLSLRLTDSNAAFNLASLPVGLRLFRIHDSLCTVTASAGTTPPAAFEVAEFHNLALTQAVVDDVLATLATIDTWTGAARIDIGGTNAERSTDSNADVLTLQGNGVTVNANGPVDVGGGDPPPIDPPPIERVGVIYFSGAESGPSWPGGASTTDGWSRQNLSGNLAEALQLAVAADHGISARAGNRVLRAYYSASWGQDSGGNYRSEVLQPGGLYLENGTEYWIGFSVFMKDDAAMRAIKNTSRINSSVFQFHQVGGTGTSQMMIRNGQWEFRFGNISGKTFLGNAVLGQWNDFVIHCKPATDSSGFCKLWLNADSDADAPIYNKTGVSGWASQPRMSFKLGVYRNDLIEDGIAYAEQFYDEIRWATGAGASFNSVKPGN